MSSTNYDFVEQTVVHGSNGTGVEDTEPKLTPQRYSSTITQPSNPKPDTTSLTNKEVMPYKNLHSHYKRNGTVTKQVVLSTTTKPSQLH